MAKSTKYVAKKKIVRLNGKNYEVGEEVTGLNKEQEKRLSELNAIEKGEADEGAKENAPEGDADGGKDAEK